MRGRKPKPTALKKLTGNPGTRKLNAHEAKLKAEMPECPPSLTDEAKREWERVSAELFAVGLLTRVDRAALAAYCQIWARWVQAEEKIAKTGMIMKTDKGNICQNPYVGIANRSLLLMKAYLVEFGLTPSSRSRVHAETPTPEDQFSDFLGDPVLGRIGA